MARRALSVFLALVLVLGWTSTIAWAGCDAPAGKAAASLSAVAGGCGTCEEDDDSGQLRGCAVLACSAGCVSGPATAAGRAPTSSRAVAVETVPPAAQDRLRARAIPPDHPPPR